jgi:hypothetical protein
MSAARTCDSLKTNGEHVKEIRLLSFLIQQSVNNEEKTSRA